MYAITVRFVMSERIVAEWLHVPAAPRTGDEVQVQFAGRPEPVTYRAGRVLWKQVDRVEKKRGHTDGGLIAVVEITPGGLPESNWYAPFEICDRCHAVKSKGQSCGCFDNGGQ